jgi:DMSO/TMAO reductase YedYZ molybdopterin-dependent catalytic subunit
LEKSVSEEKTLNKTRKIVLASISIALVIIALAASIYYLTRVPALTSNLDLPRGNPPNVQLKITGDVAEEKTLNINDLSQLPMTNVTTIIKGETAIYLGVTMLQFINHSGASWDAGFINIIASDGFNKTINTYQAYNSTQYPGKEIILAFAKNGNWITDIDEGPLKLITPGLASNFNVKSVSEIRLQPWTINVTGAVSNPLLLTSRNLTNYETKKVQAALAPGGEPQRTSEWTGVSLWSILQASGLSEGSSKVTVSAIDGYSREYTIQQSKELGILIGYKENGSYLTPVNGQPYRLVVPMEDFKWGQYWVRWVSGVTVA